MKHECKTTVKHDNDVTISVEMNGIMYLFTQKNPSSLLIDRVTQFNTLAHDDLEYIEAAEFFTEHTLLENAVDVDVIWLEHSATGAKIYVEIN